MLVIIAVRVVSMYPTVGRAFRRASRWYASQAGEACRTHTLRPRSRSSVPPREQTWLGFDSWMSWRKDEQLEQYGGTIIRGRVACSLLVWSCSREGTKGDLEKNKNGSEKRNAFIFANPQK